MNTFSELEARFNERHIELSGKTLTFPPAGVVYSRGDLASAFFTLDDGVVKIQGETDVKGSMHTLELVKAPSVLGEATLGRLSVHASTATAASEITVTRFSKEMLDTRFENSIYGCATYREVARRFSQFQEWKSTVPHSVQQRVASTLLYVAPFFEDGFIPLYEYEIGEFCNTDRSEVSTIMSGWKKKAILERDGRKKIRIVDLVQMQKIADGELT